MAILDIGYAAGEEGRGDKERETMMFQRVFWSCVVMAGLSGCGCEQIDTGHRGVKTHFGKIVGEPLGEGLEFYNPFTENVVELSVREEKLEDATPCFTKDTQNVVVSYAVTYYPDPAEIGEIYRKYGEDWVDKIVKPSILGSLKDAVGRYIADQLVSSREEVAKTVSGELAESLSHRKVFLTNLAITNLDFDDAYEKAVEEKVVAIQKAAEAKNKTVQVEEEKLQTIKRAEAEAESIKIRAQALEKNGKLVELEAVQRWDGKLPQYILGNGSVPFLNLKSM